MNEASELRKDRAKYLRRGRERGIESIAKMTPEEWAAFEKRLDEVKKFDPKKLFLMFTINNFAVAPPISGNTEIFMQKSAPSGSITRSGR